MGHSHTPVESELRAIEANLTRFNELVILVDDVRCFTGEDRRFGEYPSLDFLVAFAQRIGAKWTIEHDVFVMERRAQ